MPSASDSHGERGMSERRSRRRFLQTTAGSALGVLAAPWVGAGILGANERLNIAGIGVGGKGASDVDHCSSQNIVALCDVDATRAKVNFDRFEKAKRFTDFRRLFDEMASQIDAVTVSTPDHTHTIISMTAMRLGKHVYCQKPLTHSIHEARLMRETATQTGIATQMGNQGHSHSYTRRLIELIQGGALGFVREVHVWTDRPIWPQGIERPKDRPKVPSDLDWDLWLGPARERPYHPAYVPFNWRGFWDFGTGALGDMACHNMDLAFTALDLRDPVTVEAKTSPVNDETAPKWSIITYHFPKRGDGQAVKLTWYDGGKKPPAGLVKGAELATNGSILVGDKDTLYVPHYWGGGRFVSGAKVSDFDSIRQSIPRRGGAEDDRILDREHHLEWIEACKGGAAARSNFDYSGPLTESVLLGNLAVRTGEKIEWDAENLVAKNSERASRLVRGAYREGWSLPEWV